MIDVEEILSKMNPNQKINYDRVMQKMVQVWEKNGIAIEFFRLLLH